MVNNHQRNAGSEDDRDSASLSLITPLDVGDQVSVPSTFYTRNLWPWQNKLVHFETMRLTNRHLSNIDCLLARTACLVCFISTVNARSKKRSLLRLALVAGNITNLKQSIFGYFRYLWSEHALSGWCSLF
jgi:hypothetical protein